MFNKMKKSSILIILFIFGINFLSAQPPGDKKLIRGYNFQIENDLLPGLVGLKNRDKDYSGGFKFELYTDYLNYGTIPFIKNLGERRGNGTEYLNFNSIYAQGMGFTPDRDAFGTSQIVNDQRPYASVLGFGKRRIAYFDSAQLSIETDLFIGKVGLKGPGNVQNFIHEYISDSDPVLGWSNQIGNGGRWVYSYRLRANLNLSQYFIDSSSVYFYAEPHVTIGNLFRNAGIGFSLSDRSPLSKGLITAMGSNNIEMLEDNGGLDYDGCFWCHFNWELYAKYQYVGHNTLLMGLPFQDNSVYTISDEDIERNVFDFGAKILFNYFPESSNIRSKSMHSTFFIEFIYRTKEFSFHEPHMYGNLGVTVFFLGDGHFLQ